VREARESSPDPGDAALLNLAAEEGRILVTIDTDFGTLVYLAQARHMPESSAYRTCRRAPGSR
jgi:predicted nuclease of predicted toxin-antitoxin system